jgi:hypothetical protein
MLYELLTGSRPYSGDSDFDTMMQHVTDELPPLPPALSPFAALLRQMTVKRPDDRIGNVTDVTNQLDNADDAWQHGNAAPEPNAAIAVAQGPTAQKQRTQLSADKAVMTDRVNMAERRLLKVDSADSATCDQAVAAIGAVGHDIESAIVRHVATLRVPLQTLARAGTPDSAASATLAPLFAAIEGREPVANQAVKNGLANLASVRELLNADNTRLAVEQATLRSLGEALETSMEVGELLDQRLCAAIGRDAGVGGSVTAARLRKNLALALGKRLAQLQRVKELYEQGVLTTELLKRNNEQWMRGIERVSPSSTPGNSEQQHLSSGQTETEILSSKATEALKALLIYRVKARIVLTEAADELMPMFDDVAANAVIAEQISRENKEICDELGL